MIVTYSAQMCVCNVHTIVVTMVPEKTWYFYAFHLVKHTLLQSER